MISSVGSGAGNPAEVLGLMAQQSGQGPTVQGASMAILKTALNVAQVESASLISEVGAVAGSGSLSVYA